MSDFEIVTLFNDQLNTSFSRLNDFMVGLFALLVTAYMAGRDLPSRLAGLVVVLYTMFSTATVVAAILSFHRFALTAELVRAAGMETGSVLAVLFPVLPAPSLVTPIVTILLVGAYLGGLGFFLQVRRGARDA